MVANTLGAVYSLKSHNHYKSLGIYGNGRRLWKAIDITHAHTSRYRNGKKQRLAKEIARVHNICSGRESNARYMTEKEIKKYGKAILAMGGRMYEQ